MYVDSSICMFEFGLLHPITVGKDFSIVQVHYITNSEKYFKGHLSNKSIAIDQINTLNWISILELV